MEHINQSESQFRDLLGHPVKPRSRNLYDHVYFGQLGIETTYLGLVGGRRRCAVEPVVGLVAAVQAEGAPVAGSGNDVLGGLVRRLGHPLQLNVSPEEWKWRKRLNMHKSNAGATQSARYPRLG